MSATTEEANKAKAQEMCLLAIDNKFCTTYSMDETNETDVSELFYSVERAPKYKNVYFVKLNKSQEISKHCPLVRKKSRKHKTGRTNYCVNIASGRVICMCFSSKCKERNGGKYIMVEPDESSSEESDFQSSDDDDEATTETKKRKRDQEDDDEK